VVPIPYFRKGGAYSELLRTQKSTYLGCFRPLEWIFSVLLGTSGGTVVCGACV
jgi:hypothetical protein